MSLAGIVFMAISWILIGGLTVFCFVNIFRKDDRENREMKND